MPDQDTARIPLFARDGSIRDYALVDAGDAVFLNQWRWHLNGSGYAVRMSSRADGSRIPIRLHCVLLNLGHGAPFIGDHINRDRLDNRRANLRTIPPPANQQNQSSRSGATSKHRGVSWDAQTSKWRVVMQVDGKFHSLGRFATEHEAAEVARSARARLMPYAVD